LPASLRPSTVLLIMRTIAIANQKGGAGKTTTAVHLAVALRQLGHRVLLIDLDGQGNATTYLGLEKSGRALLDALVGRRSLLSAVEQTSFGVDVLAGGQELEGIDVVLYLEKKHHSAHLLKWQLDKLEDKWDFALIDCPPNLGVATASALMAASEVLIPVQTEAMAAEGVARLHANIEEARAINNALKIIGVLPCMSVNRESLSQEVEMLLREHFGKLVFSVSIRRNTRVAQSYTARAPMQVFDPKNQTVKQYNTVARELVARGQEAAA
jgi:chromosome partitioning protein